eukprot:TRINITY_DN76978_c0_g1_i1.p1 TRINITY_DN76978_c0_g1~~TRINITY_DN76978_c0_g1_i1.p1  ORF type:complete len:350 (+),score=42.89 TRINITY_DN76978_c0_g1_i1:88-1137(+)
MSMDMRHKETYVTCAIVVFGLIAGSAFLVTKEASRSLPPATLTACRLLLGVLSLFLIHVLVRGMKSTWRTIVNVSKAEAMRVALVGALNTTVPYTLFGVAAVSGVDVSVSATLSGASPLFAAVIASVLVARDERQKHGRLFCVGMVVGFGGTILVAVKSQMSASSQGHTAFVGIYAQFAGVLSKSLAAIFAEITFKRSADIDEFSFALGQTLAGALIAIVLAVVWDFMLVPERGRVVFDPTFNWRMVAPAVLYLGLMSSCVVYLLQFYVVRFAGGARQMMVDYLTPVVGVLEGALFRCEFCDSTTAEMSLAALGCTLSLVGVALVQWEQRRQGCPREDAPLDCGDIRPQ